MLTLATAVVVASLVGSFHCVGMCGPFALWATTGGNRTRNLTAYHLGRLTTYLSAGLAAGAVGSALTIGGEIAGFQSLAALIAGGLLVFIGISRLLLMAVPLSQTEPRPSQVAAWIHRAKPVITRQGPAARAYIGGLLTTWLPCGWLYLFVLVAGGTGDVFLSLSVMFAFWMGTIPALTGLVLGAHTLLPKFRRFVPVGAAVLLIVTGMYTASGRASADLSTMMPPRVEGDLDALSLIGLTEQELPCCQPTSKPPVVP